MRTVFGTLVAATLVIGGSETTMASEPGNNSFTFNSTQDAGDFEALISTSTSLSAGTWNGSMDSSSDVDYIVVSCASTMYPKIDDVRLGGVPLGGNLPGDYDIYVYAPESGAFLGSGVLGGTSPETVNLHAFGRNTVVVKIILYTGATGSYRVRVDCF
jgi:hypothetical protein